MKFTRLPGMLVLLASLFATGANAEIRHYVRYEHGGSTHYGLVDGAEILELDAAPYLGGKRTGKSLPANDAKLLAPAEPAAVFAVGFNYLSHRGDLELPPQPPIFLKLPTTIIGPGADIVYPDGATNVHFEAELVIVIGKTAKGVSAQDAGDYIFGITAGNDVSERDWQANDLQWFRGKASDTFGPIGPVIATGVNYRDVLVQARLNGKVMQSQRTSDHIHDAHAIVSFISQYATLQPGDLIFTGTPGSTSGMEAGDVIEIEVEGVGILRNTIVGAKQD
jgi:2-keto-4-pentenoate hydratase/2-oxohepta-3-ene-1,7-dioic acid hydratase in catechol pathway